MRSTHTIRATVTTTLALLVCSCAAKNEKMFSIDVIDSREEHVPCVVFREDTLVLDENNQPVVTPANIPVPFVWADDGFKSVKVGVRAVELDDRGQVIGGLQDGEESPFVEDLRYVYDSDAPKQLFILRRNKDYQE